MLSIFLPDFLGWKCKFADEGHLLMAKLTPPILCEPPHQSDPPAGPATPSRPQIRPPVPPTNPRPPDLTPRDDRDANIDRWFLQPGPRTRLTTANKVRYYVHALEYWRDLAADLDRLIDPLSDVLYTAGWEYGLNVSIKAKRGETLETVLRDIGDNHKIAVRVLVPRFRNTDDPTKWTDQNLAIRDLVGGLANGGAVFDPYRYVVGTHHQKMVVLVAEGELVAYVGGIDLHPFRTNWTDSQCRITGPAAFDFYLSFFERWTAVSNPGIRFGTNPNDVKGRRDPGPVVHAPRPPSGPPDPSAVSVQAWRTYSKQSFTNSGYPFAPEGERTTYQGLANAIQKARRFIYLEDQYLFAATPMREGPDIATLLANKLRDGEFAALVILIARTEALNAEMYQGWRRRADFIQRLQAMGQGKVIVCQYRIALGTQVDYNLPSYVHAKTWVFDDRLALVGSANCNRRGYTYDGEIGAAVYDVVENGDRLSAPHELRIAQWLRALNEPSPGIKRSTPAVKRADVIDFLGALDYWRNPASDAAIEPYTLSSTASTAKNQNPDHSIIKLGRAVPDSYAWDTLLDPDGS